MTQDLSTAILLEGLDDWVPLLSVHFAAEKLFTGGEAELQELILSTVQDLLEQRLVEIGTVSDSGFSSWDVSGEVARQRLAEAFATDDENWWGFAAWLCNTARGDDLARLNDEG